MKLKSLVVNFSHERLIRECDKQDWRLPTLEEARTLPTDHDEFWIQPEVPIHNEYDAVYYSKSRNRIGYMNKTHGLTTAVIIMPQICSRCEHYSAPRGCLAFDFTIPTAADQFGCSTDSFKRREE